MTELVNRQDRYFYKPEKSPNLVSKEKTYGGFKKPKMIKEAPLVLSSRFPQWLLLDIHSIPNLVLSVKGRGIFESLKEDHLGPVLMRVVCSRCWNE